MTVGHVIPAPRLALVEALPPVSVLTVLDDWRTVLDDRPGRPDVDDVVALTVDTHGAGSVQLHIDGYRAFLHWACWLGLAFTRVHRAGGFVIAARGPVKAGTHQLLVHLSCTYPTDRSPV